MALAACRRILEELLFASKQRQLAPYRSSDVNAIVGEIEQRRQAIQSILDAQRSQIENAELQQDSHIAPDLLEFPHVPIWVHVSAIQQLHRGLMIYRYERHKLIVRCGMECARLGCDPPMAVLERLPEEEGAMLRQLLSDGSLTALCRGTTTEPAEEDTQPLQRCLTVKEDLLPCSAVVAAFDLPAVPTTGTGADTNRGAGGEVSALTLLQYAKLLAEVDDDEVEQSESYQSDASESDHPEDRRGIGREQRGTLYLYAKKRMEERRRRRRQQSARQD